MLAASALESWRRAEFQGQTIVVDALVRRRAAEKALFLTPPDGFRPVPTPVVRAEFDFSLLQTRAGRDALASAADLRTRLDGPLAAAELQPRTPAFDELAYRRVAPTT